MKAFTILSLLTAASFVAAAPLNKRIYTPEETRIATAYPKSEARKAQMEKRVYVPEETRISTAYAKSDAQLEKESKE